MAVPAQTPSLTPAQIASIPSASLPLGPQITHLLTQFTALSLTLFQLLSTSTPSASSQTSAIYDQLAALDRKLAGVLGMMEKHQRRQRRIDQLASEVRAAESQWQKGAHSLHSALASLAPIVSSGALDRASISAAASPPLDTSTMLSYARLLAPFTSAPPSSLFPPEQKEGMIASDPSGRTLPQGAIPPFPTEGAMRRGRLQFAAVGLEEGGLGETGEVGGGQSSRSLLPCRSSLAHTTLPY